MRERKGGGGMLNRFVELQNRNRQCMNHLHYIHLLAVNIDKQQCKNMSLLRINHQNLQPPTCNPQNNRLFVFLVFNFFCFWFFVCLWPPRGAEGTNKRKGRQLFLFVDNWAARGAMNHALKDLLCSKGGGRRGDQTKKRGRAGRGAGVRCFRLRTYKNERRSICYI